MKKRFIYLSVFTTMYSCNTATIQENHVGQQASVLVLESNIDPICKMDVQTNRTDTILHEGKIYGFCSPVCKELFIEKNNHKKNDHE